MVEIINEKEFHSKLPSIDKSMQVLNGFINYMEKAKLK